MEKKKLKIALYWAASCGGCEIAVLDVNEKILDVVAAADIVFPLFASAFAASRSICVSALDWSSSLRESTWDLVKTSLGLGMF